MPLVASPKGLRWADITKPVLLGCVSGTLVVAILWGMNRKSSHPKTIHWEKKSKKQLGWGGFDPESNDVDLEAVHEFYKAVQEDPLLYPYFMNVKAEKREDVMRNIASLFHKTLQKQFSPEDSVRLRNIHKNLNITDAAYNKFTKLFAHICCKGKSDKLRARMLKSFAMLKSEICSPKEQQPITISDFFRLITNCGSIKDIYSPADTKRKTSSNRVLHEKNTSPHKVYFPRDSAQSLVLGRAKAWNNRSTHDQLRKKIVELEVQINRLSSLNHSLDLRIKAMEPISPVEYRRENFFNRQSK